MACTCSKKGVRWRIDHSNSVAREPHSHAVTASSTSLPRIRLVVGKDGLCSDGCVYTAEAISNTRHVTLAGGSGIAEKDCWLSTAETPLHQATEFVIYESA